MSQSAMQEITCPKCGKKTSFRRMGQHQYDEGSGDEGEGQK